MVTAPGIVAQLALWIEAAVKGTTADFEVNAVSVINIHLIVQHVAPAPRGEHYHLDHEQMQPESRHALSHSLDQTTPWPIVNARARQIPVFVIKTTSLQQCFLGISNQPGRALSVGVFSQTSLAPVQMVPQKQT